MSPDVTNADAYAVAVVTAAVAVVTAIPAVLAAAAALLGGNYHL